MWLANHGERLSLTHGSYECKCAGMWQAHNLSNISIIFSSSLTSIIDTSKKSSAARCVIDTRCTWASTEPARHQILIYILSLGLEF